MHYKCKHFFIVLNLGGLLLVKRAFLAAPFKQLLNQQGVVQPLKIQEIKAMIALFEKHDFMVDNAHKREKWGEKMMTPKQCTIADYEAIKQCDLFVAFPGNPASPGTHIEIGWASAHNKRIILLLNEHDDYAYLVQGLKAIANVTYLYYKSIDDSLLKMAELLNSNR